MEKKCIWELCVHNGTLPPWNLCRSSPRKAVSPRGIPSYLSMLHWFTAPAPAAWLLASVFPAAKCCCNCWAGLMEVIFTGHVYNLQSDLSHRGLISQRSMTMEGFQKLSSLSNFLCPNEMAATCVESFWLETSLRVNKEYDIHKSKWKVTWLSPWFIPWAFCPALSRVCCRWQTWDKVRFEVKVWGWLDPSSWIQRTLLP